MSPTKTNDVTRPKARDLGSPVPKDVLEAQIARVGVIFQQSGDIRTLPESLDQMLDENGYTLSVASFESNTVGMAALQQRHVLRASDLPEARRAALMLDISEAGFEHNASDDSFRRADQTLYWQVTAIRDTWREQRRAHWDANFSARRTEREVDEMNHALRSQNGNVRVEPLLGSDPSTQVAPGGQSPGEREPGLLGRRTAEALNGR